MRGGEERGIRKFTGRVLAGPEAKQETSQQMKKSEQVNMATKLTPLADRVIVRRFEAEGTPKSGIVLPDAAREKPTKGKVIAVGPGKMDDNGKRTEVSVRVGETVVYGKYSGTEVELDGEKFVILRETDLLGVLE